MCLLNVTFTDKGKTLPYSYFSHTTHLSEHTYENMNKKIKFQTNFCNFPTHFYRLSFENMVTFLCLWDKDKRSTSEINTQDI